MARRAASTRSVLEKNKNALESPLSLFVTKSKNYFSSKRNLSQTWGQGQVLHEQILLLCFAPVQEAMHMEGRPTYPSLRFVCFKCIFCPLFPFSSSVEIFSIFNHVPPPWRSAAYWLLGDEREAWARFKLSCELLLLAPLSRLRQLIPWPAAATLAGQGGKAQLKSSEPRTSPALTINAESWDSQFEFEGSVVVCLSAGVKLELWSWGQGSAALSLARKSQVGGHTLSQGQTSFEQLRNQNQKSHRKTRTIYFQKLQAQNKHEF